MLSLTTGPAAELFDASEAKSYLRVDHSSDDTIITDLITAATKLAEQYTGRGFINQTWVLSLDRIPVERRPGTDWEGVRDGAISELSSLSRAIDLKMAPVASITNVKYLTQDNTETTIDTSVYGLDSTSAPGRLYLKTGQSWPTDLRDFDCFRVTMVVGYGAAGSNVPKDIRTAVKQIVAHLYENRGDQDSPAMPPTARALLAPYVVRRIG